MHPLVFGVQFGEIVGIVVLVISVLSWFVNVIQGNTVDGALRQKKPQPKPQQGRNDIEELLKGLTGEKRKPDPEQRPPQPPKPSKPAERPRSKPNPALQRPGGTPRTSAPPRQGNVGAEAKQQLGKQPAGKLTSANLGSGVRSQHLGSRVDTEVAQDIGAAVQNDLGRGLAIAPSVHEQSIHPLVKVLRDPQGVRQAVLLNEILQRPKSLRH